MLVFTIDNMWQTQVGVGGVKLKLSKFLLVLRMIDWLIASCVYIILFDFIATCSHLGLSFKANMC